jgi:hypothetical protein
MATVALTFNFFNSKRLQIQVQEGSGKCHTREGQLVGSFSVLGLTIL